MADGENIAPPTYEQVANRSVRAIVTISSVTRPVIRGAPNGEQSEKRLVRPDDVVRYAGACARFLGAGRQVADGWARSALRIGQFIEQDPHHLLDRAKVGQELIVKDNDMALRHQGVSHDRLEAR